MRPGDLTEVTIKGWWPAGASQGPARKQNRTMRQCFQGRFKGNGRWEDGEGVAGAKESRVCWCFEPGGIRAQMWGLSGMTGEQ